MGRTLIQSGGNYPRQVRQHRFRRKLLCNPPKDLRTGSGHRSNPRKTSVGRATSATKSGKQSYPERHEATASSTSLSICRLWYRQRVPRLRLRYCAKAPRLFFPVKGKRQRDDAGGEHAPFAVSYLEDDSRPVHACAVGPFFKVNPFAHCYLPHHRKKSPSERTEALTWKSARPSPFRSPEMMPSLKFSSPPLR